MSVGLVVNSYERTYRHVLSKGFFPHIVESNRRDFDEVVALINNVADRHDAEERARELVELGQITSYAFVGDHVSRALRAAHLTERALRPRPYLLDYGLVMPHVLSTDWLLGWDAETRLVVPANWVDPAIELMRSDARIFHASVKWPVPDPLDAGLEGDSIGTIGNFHLSWGFSDQLFLLRRESLIGARYSNWSPAALARHAPHPYTFEARMESHQRGTRKLRATLESVSYQTSHSDLGVLERTGKGSYEDLRRRALHRFERNVTKKLPSSLGPRFSRNAGLDQARPRAWSGG